MSHDDEKKIENEKNQKRQSLEDHVAQLIDKKRRHLERRLSASQRDAFLIKETK